MKFMKLLLGGAVVAIMAGGCSTKRSPLTYFTDIETFEQETAIGDYAVRIEPSDELFITVTSTMPLATAHYNLPLANPATNELLNSSITAQQQTYIVDPDGDISFPVLGRLHVAGMTTKEVKEMLTERISKDVEDPTVRVELVNFKVNVAGEVVTPGQQKVTTERYSILDALTAAGDLTPFAERDNVLVVREENGKRVHGRLNLNSAEIFESPYFFLKQNDYVYVEPNKIRKDNAKYNQNNAFKLSITSTIVSAASVIASLVIALTVK